MNATTTSFVNRVVGKFDRTEKLNFLMGNSPFHSYKHLFGLLEKEQEKLTTAEPKKKSYIKRQVKKLEEKIQETISKAEEKYKISAADFVEFAELYRGKEGREIFALLMTNKEKQAIA